MYVCMYVLSYYLMIIAIVMNKGKQGYITLPWQLNWVQTVVFESLNFSVLAALCIVCRPTGVVEIIFVKYVCIHDEMCCIYVFLYVCMYVCMYEFQFPNLTCLGNIFTYAEDTYIKT